jgi:hypothetical protein
MHSQNGFGLAGNYLAWTNSPSDSTGTGTMFNLGFQYDNSLSNILGTRSDHAPDLKFSAFGLLTSASLELPAGSQIPQDKLKQLKYGADVTLQAVDWLSVMLRGDTVVYDVSHAGFVFSALTARLTLYTHVLSGESVYLQYSRYFYGDRMVLAGKWDWNAPMVAGTDVVQAVGYSGKEPDAHVIKLQASAAF